MVRYRLLGPLAVERDGHDLDLGSPKQRAVLAVLAQDAGRPVSTDRLLDAVWGASPPASVTASLQAYLSNLRRVLRAEAGAPSPIVRRARGYVLDVEPGAVDVGDFLAAAQAARAAVEARDWAVAVRSGRTAVDLWRGAYLADFADEEWARVAAVPLQEQRQGAQQDLVVGLLGIGDVTTALARAATMAAEQPLVERAAWLHMVALHRAGRTGRALETFAATRAALDEELGLEVGPALRDLQAALLRQDPAIDSWPGSGATPTPAPAPTPAPDSNRDSAPDSGLVGRRPELLVIDDALARAREQGPGWIVLSGRPGIGKTRLALEAAARWQSAGGRVIRASCPDDAGVPPWWAARQVVQGLGGDPAAVLAAPGGADADTVRFAVLERTCRALIEAPGPVLVFVDDVHWADSASLHWLTFLAESAERRGLAVVLTARDDERRPGLDRLLGAVARRAGSRQLTVPPLDATEVADLVSRISGDPLESTEAAALAERSGGNPFFAGEFARLSPAERRRGVMPVAVRSVLRRRLAGVPTSLLDLLAAAAVLGEPLDVGLLARVTGLDVDTVADQLDRAADLDILAPALTTGAYAFAHALMRDEVLAGLPTLRRQRINLRAAGELTGRADQQVRRASHLRDAGDLADPAEVYAAARAVATAADRDWQPERAATWWDETFRAFERLPEQDPARRHELVHTRVAALTRAGRGQELFEVLDAALAEALREGRTEAVGVLAANLVRVTGSWPWPVYGSDPAPLMNTLHALAPRLAHDPAAQARVLAATAIGRCYDPDPAVPDDLSRRAIELARATGDDDVVADAVLGRAMTYSGVATRARESVELLTGPNRLDDLDEVLRHNILTMAHLTLGDLGAFAAHLEAGAAGSDLLRLQLNRVQFRWAEAALAQWRGDLDRADRLYARAEVSHRQTDLQQSGTFELAELTMAWHRGRLDRFVSTVPSNAEVSNWMSAVAAAAAGRPGADEGLAAEVARAEPVVWTSHGRLTLLAHAVADRGLTTLAPALLAQLDPFAGLIANLGQTGTAGPVDLARARLADLAGDRLLAREVLREARELSEKTDGAPAVLRCRLVAAQWAARDGESVPEVGALRAEAAARGLAGVARECDQLIERT